MKRREILVWAAIMLVAILTTGTMSFSDEQIAAARYDEKVCGGMPDYKQLGVQCDE